MKVDYQSLTDAQLADLLNLRDESAFEEIYKRYWSLLFIHANKMLGDQDQAEDVVQELFTKLLSQMGELYLKSTISAYLYMSVRNMVVNLIRRKKVKINYLASIQEHYSRGEWVTDHKLRESEFRKQIEEEIENLPPKMKAIFNLSSKAYLTHKEIAEAVNVSEGTVRKQIYYAMKALRSKLTCLVCLQVMSVILWLHRSI